MTDNSYKLFAADPTPGHDPRKLVGASRSTNDLSTTPARDFLPEDDGKDQAKEKDKSAQKDQKDTAVSNGASTASNTGDKKETIKGPWRILRLLPRESRHIVHKMLEIDPKKRANMEEILQEPWVADTPICQQFEHGQIIPADNHSHILEPPASQPSASQKN